MLAPSAYVAQLHDEASRLGLDLCGALLRPTGLERLKQRETERGEKKQEGEEEEEERELSTAATAAAAASQAWSALFLP